MREESFSGGCRHEPLVCVVVPVFNQEEIVGENLTALLRSMSVPHELVVIDDASEDGTRSEVSKVLRSEARLSRHLTEATLVHLPVSRFETYCDQLALGRTHAPWVLEVQADMRIIEAGFDRKLIDAMESFPDLMMLSGRGAVPFAMVAETYLSGPGSDVARGGSVIQHAAAVTRAYARRILSATGIRRDLAAALPASEGAASPGVAVEGTVSADLVNPSPDRFRKSRTAGRIGAQMDYPIDPRSLGERRIWIGESVMRGPLMMHREKVMSVGGFDVKRFFLGSDDHDLALRGFLKAGYRCGYVPIGFESPLAHGTTRRPRSVNQEALLLWNLARIRSSWKSSALYQFLTSGQELGATIEVRDF